MSAINLKKEKQLQVIWYKVETVTRNIQEVWQVLCNTGNVCSTAIDIYIQRNTQEIHYRKCLLNVL